MKNNSALALCGLLIVAQGALAHAADGPAYVPGSPVPSTSYEKIYTNNDGSVFIVKPYFRQPTGDAASLRISAASDLNGVCKLYGFGHSRASLKIGDMRDRTVSIGSDGKIRGFRNYTEEKRDRQTTVDAFTGKLLRIDYYKRSSDENSYIFNLVCFKGSAPHPAVPTAQERSEDLYVNDDGTVTLVNPYVGDKWISSRNSDRQGICKYFKLGKYRTATYGGDMQENTANIAASGSVTGFTQYDKSYSNTKLNSIVCDNVQRKQ